MNANTGLITPKVFNWCQLVCAILVTDYHYLGGTRVPHQPGFIRGCTSGTGWADGGGLQVNLQHDPEDWDSTDFPLLWSLLIYGFVWKCCVPLNPMVLLIIIPIKWQLGIYPIFRQTHILILLITVLTTHKKIRFLSWLWFQEHSECSFRRSFGCFDMFGD